MSNKRSLAVHAHLRFSNQHVHNGGIQKEDGEWPVDVAGSVIRKRNSNKNLETSHIQFNEKVNTDVVRTEEHEKHVTIEYSQSHDPQEVVSIPVETERERAAHLRLHS